MTACLTGIRVLDLSRIFSGPWAGQLLADLGADVIKVERPGSGDDVRHLGYRLKNAAGEETTETSSFLAMNRGKRSIAIDLGQPAGQELIASLAERCDVLLENFKAGDLERYGLGQAALRARNPRLIYCSISGFGQTGPDRHLPGYDPIFQGLSGLMSFTGNADGEAGAGPQRTGYAVSDINAGFYATIAILAALRHRDATSGVGQYIDLAMLDAQIASISHIAINYLVSGILPQRTGTASPITCPYQAFACADGSIMIAVGNDQQFARMCEVLELGELASDPRFATNRKRIEHRTTLVPLLAERIARSSVSAWNAAFARVGVPCGPIRDFEQVFADPQVQHRNVRGELPHPLAGRTPIVANPIKFSDSPIEYLRPPPLLGEHTREVLTELLALDPSRLDALASARVIA